MDGSNFCIDIIDNILDYEHLFRWLYGLHLLWRNHFQRMKY